MRMRGFVLILLLLGGLLLPGCGSSGDAQQQVTISTVRKGEVSPGASNPVQVKTIRDNLEWANFWNQLYNSYSSKPALPPIDFSESSIVAVVDAPRPTGGYSITITSIQPASVGVTVNAHQVSPGPNCTVTQAVTQPFHVVTLPIFQGEATLALSQSVSNCGQ